jgi:hypothetical protein
MVIELEGREKLDPIRNDPAKCPHYSINRVLDQYFCTVCGAKFIPTNSEHRTTFRTSMKFKPE